MNEITAEYKQAQSLLEEIGYPAFVKALFNRSGDLSKDFSHALLGVITECHELMAAKDQVNAFEEAGDILFYCVALHTVLQEHAPDSVFDPGSEGSVEFGKMLEANISGAYVTPREALEKYTWDNLDHAKRWVGYGKAPSGDTVKQILVDTAAMSTRAIDAVLPHDPSMEHVMTINVCKLLERYKGTTYSQERAINRDVAAERDVLERTV